MAKFSQLAKRLQTAINQQSGVKLLINTQQWYSDKKERPVTYYIIRQGTGKRADTLFKTYSQVQMVLWLRDYWYKLNDWEVPMDNTEWEEIKRQYESDIERPTE